MRTVRKCIDFNAGHLRETLSPSPSRAGTGSGIDLHDLSLASACYLITCIMALKTSKLHRTTGHVLWPDAFLYYLYVQY